MIDEQFEDDLYDGPSRSQVKREMLELQAMGARLMDMGVKEWKRLPLSDTILAALHESFKIHEKTARKRHRKHLGKLLREEDTDAIEELFKRLDNQQQQENQRFHQLEIWRDRLIHGGIDAMTEFLQHVPHADRQHLNQLLRQARKEHDLDKPPAASRKLFKYLRELDIE